MSLLDRVQRKAEEGGAPASRPASQGDPSSMDDAAQSPPQLAPPPTPVPPAPAEPQFAAAAPLAPLAANPPPDEPEDDPDGEPRGWGVRSASSEPAAAPLPGTATVSAPPPALPATNRITLPPAQPAAAALPPAAPARPNPFATRSQGGEGDAPRQTSLLNRTGMSRGAGQSTKGGPGGMYSLLRSKVHQRLVEELAGNTDSAPPEAVKQRISELVNEVVAEQNITMGRQDKQRVIEVVIHDVLGLGPLEDLLANEEITEIMINSYKQIYIEEHGKLTMSPVTFESNDQLMQVIDRIVSSIGRRVDESSPMVDARLKDGSRVNVIIPPLALRGPTVTIRKFAKEALTIDDLVRYGSVTEDMVSFMRACVRGRLNVVVSGGTGSGKTTTLNILSGFIPEDERIVTIEDAAELQLRQDHVVTLETRPANVEGRGKVTIRDLVINALRMRPDRIVIGECRGGEALDMLQAMNTGHDGSLTTLHANNAKECIGRLETLVLMAGAELPSRAIREQIGSAVNIIVQQSRLRDGTRKIVSISEVLGTDGETVKLQDIFVFKQTGLDEEGRVLGSLQPTGIMPFFLEHLASEGEGLAESMFRPVHVMDDEETPSTVG